MYIFPSLPTPFHPLPTEHTHTNKPTADESRKGSIFKCDEVLI